CNEIDLEGIRSNRERLFAEAVHRFKAGDSWWIMPTDETNAEQESRYSEDVWTEFIAKYIGPKNKVTVTGILTECFQIEKAKIQKADQMRVATCLHRLQWTKGKPERDDNDWKERVRYWRPQGGEVGGDVGSDVKESYR